VNYVICELTFVSISIIMFQKRLISKHKHYIMLVNDLLLKVIKWYL